MTTAYYRPGALFPGQSVLYVDDAGAVEVLLPAGLTECVIFVFGFDRRGDFRPFGTAFVVSDPVAGAPEMRRPYIITARHVIEEIRHQWNPETVEDDRARTEPYVYLRPPPQKDSNEPFGVRMALTNWFFHPRDDSAILGEDWMDPKDGVPRYDVAAAACPHVLATDTRLRVIALESHVLTVEEVAKFNVGIGDEIAITGLYYQHVGNSQNIPIFRSGMIAAMPIEGEPVAAGLGEMHGAYLVEARSTSGLSGSPAFWLSGFERRDGETGRMTRLAQSKVALLGLVHGHYDEHVSAGSGERLNEGIAIIEPVQHIIETIRQEQIVASHKDEDREVRRNRSGPTMDAFVARAVADPEEGRISLAPVDPQDALRALLKTPPHAQTQDPA